MLTYIHHKEDRGICLFTLVRNSPGHFVHLVLVVYHIHHNIPLLPGKRHLLPIK